MVNLLNILVPLYIYPTGCWFGVKDTRCLWYPFFQAIEANKQVTFNMVINIDNGLSGPNSLYQYPNSDYIPVIAQLNSYNNTRVIGYLDSGFTAIAPTTYKPRIKTYANWANYTSADIHVDGIFIDDVSGSPWNTTITNYYVQWAKDINSTLPASAEKYIVVNPGTPIDCNYYGNVSNVITFENYYSALGNADFKKAQWNACPRVKQTVLVHDFNGTALDQQQLSDDMGETYRIGNLFVTNQTQNDAAQINPYSSVSGLWSQFAASVTSTDSWISAHPQWYS